MTKESGRVGKPTGLSSSTEPEDGLGPSGFDPSRNVGDMLWLFREFVMRNAAQWELGAGHHHPIWRDIAEIAPEPGMLAGAYWRFVQPRNRKSLAELLTEDARDSDGPRMAETNEDSARGEAGPARAAESGIAQPLPGTQS